MNPKEKLLIQKLFSIADKQQKILTKLAQANIQHTDDVEANKRYLQNTWQTACLNSGIPGHTPTVEYTPGGPSSENGVTISGNYMVTGEIPANQRDKFLATFTAQVKAQKPELDGKVSTIFKDPQVG